MTKQEAEQIAQTLTDAGEEAYVSDYGPGMKTVCIMADGTEHEYRSIEEFNACQPARVGPPAEPNEIRAFPIAGSKLERA